MLLLPSIAKNSLTHLRQRKVKRRANAKNSQVDDPSIGSWPKKGHLAIDCPDPTEEEAARDVHQTRGVFLARQDRWAELAHEIRIAEKARTLTPAGMSAAELLSFGARSDVVLAVEHALYDGHPPRGARLTCGVEALENMLLEAAPDVVLSTVVAQAHMDIAWAWRGTGSLRQVPTRNREAFDAHFDRAREILDPFHTSETTSPILAQAVCTLHGAGKATGNRLTRDFETLIDLDPRNPKHMRTFGSLLSPHRFGSHEQLELQARRTAARSQEAWGAGGYTWVMFDALPQDDVACAHLDLAFFLEGLHDILARNPDQHTVNLLAAYCAVAIGQSPKGLDAADHPRRCIADCADWIVRTHMKEMHPMIWAHAGHRFDNNFRVPSARHFAEAGRASGIRILKQIFERELEMGQHITFTDEGPVAQASHVIR